ncbi:hypothetical protein BGZ60DRAFT_8425 [Tricladium varicosporioides]|nr:hypothetical protein BGZ60DRAFT_8425 [Hymenoscyphus varicosporioides]
MKFTNTIAVLSMASMALALPNVAGVAKRTGDNSCQQNGGQNSCCAQKLSPTDKSYTGIAKGLLDLLGLDALKLLTAPAIGVNCAAVTVIGTTPQCVQNQANVCCGTTQTAPSANPGLLGLLGNVNILNNVCPVIPITV